jgi:hypothetical protein
MTNEDERELLADEHKPHRELHERERWVITPDGTVAIMWVPASVTIPPGHTIQLVADPDGGGDKITLVRMQ